MWIPVFAGMTEYLNVDSRLRGNDGAGLRGDGVGFSESVKGSIRGFLKVP